MMEALTCSKSGEREGKNPLFSSGSTTFSEYMCSYVLYSALSIKTTVFLSVNLFLHECYTDVFNQLTDI